MWHLVGALRTGAANTRQGLRRGGQCAPLGILITTIISIFYVNFLIKLIAKLFIHLTTLQYIYNILSST